MICLLREGVAATHAVMMSDTAGGSGSPSISIRLNRVTGGCGSTTTLATDGGIVRHMNFDVTILVPTAFLTWLVVTILWNLISLHRRKSAQA